MGLFGKRLRRRTTGCRAWPLAIVESLEPRTLLALVVSSVHGTEGAAFSPTVATFDQSDALGLGLGDLSATINWGDGGPVTNGAISFDGVKYSITGTYTYRTAPTPPSPYKLTVALQRTNFTTLTASGPASVAVAAITTTGTSVTYSVGVPVPNIVGNFTDADTQLTTSDFSARIDWGDGTTAAGLISTANGSPAGAFTVQGQVPHIYTTPGPYAILTTITHAGQSTVVSSTASAPLVPIFQTNGQLLTAKLNQHLSDTTTIGTFSYVGSKPSPSFTAVIDWGDGRTTSGTLDPKSGTGPINVQGGHTYQTVGNKKVSITVQDQYGESTTFASTVAVLGPVLAVIGGNTIVVAPGTPTMGARLGTFTDSNPLANKGNITALINWGDGQSSTGTISGPDTKGVYTVKGDHSYEIGNGPYSISVTITDPSGRSAVVESTADVASPLPPTTFTGSLAGGAVSTSTDRPTFSGTANPFALVRFFARMAGVDGNPSIGQTIADANGRWSLTVGPLAQGVYTVTAMVTPPGAPPSSPFAVGPAGRVVIDTTSPVVVFLSSRLRQGQVFVTFRDDLSGMALGTLTNKSAYTLYGPRSVPLHPIKATLLPSAGLPTDPQTVLLTLGGSPRGRRNLRYVRITAAAITDSAGNPLASDFRGPLAATAYGRAGSNFVVSFGHGGPQPRTR